MSALRKGARIAAAGVTGHGRPVGQGGTAQADQDRVASFIGGIEQALDDPCAFEADQAGPQSLRDGAVGDEAPLRGRKERLRVTIERAGVRDSGKPQLGHDLPEPHVGHDRGEEVLHRLPGGIHSEAESHEGGAGSQEAHHAARDRPSLLAHTLDRRCRVVGMSRQGGPKGPQGIENLALEIVQDQPRAFRNGRRRQLIVKALVVAGPECRRCGEALEQVVHRCDLLVERIRQGHCVAEGLLPKIRMLLGGAPQEQRCGHDAGKGHDGDESHGHHQAKTGRVSRRYALGRHLVHQPCLTAERDISNVNSQAGSEWWQKWVPRHTGSHRQSGPELVPHT